MKFGSLFSGIEAASCAWLPLGWRCAWVAEIDPFASAVLRHHYPDTPNLGDITKVDWHATEPVDIVVGGPPCQDFSIAGQRAGIEGERGNLSLAYVRALDAIDPAWSLTENVPGWLSMGDNAFGRFLAAMVGSGAPLIPRHGQRWTDAGLVAGPKRTAAWRVLDAQFHGVPQRRRRVFVIAVRGAGNWACADALFPQQQSVPRNFAPRREAGEGVACSLTVGAHGSGGHQYRQRGNEDALIARCVATGSNAQRYDYETETLIAGTLDAGGGNRGLGEQAGKGNLIAFSAKDHGADHGDIAHALRADGFDASEDGTGRGTPLVTHALDSHSAGGVTEDGTGRGTPPVAVDWSNSAGGPNSEDVFMTLCQRHPAIAGRSVRRLTPRECERLQGFPDNWTDIQYRGKPAADGPKYRAIGNSFAVPVVRWIGQRIQLVEDTTTEMSDAAE